MKHITLGVNVFDAALMRLEWVFESFENICLSFSGGKDSTVLLHLAATIARKKKKKVDVLFIDWEAQYTLTIDHVQSMKTKYADVIRQFYWVALPLTTVNGVSQYQPEWVCWEQGKPWVRSPPEDAITEPDFFPFYKPQMTFEDFIPAFNDWLANGKSMASLIGIRCDESLNRYLALISQSKLRFEQERPWTTASPEGFSYTCYPLYDWKNKDIWIFHERTKLPYNPLYDLMYRAGVPFKNMRVCEPFGPEQRRGLWLYHIIEPELWGRMCLRVSGAHSGAIYANESGGFFAFRSQPRKPDGHTWRSYVLFLLDSMPQKTSEHYRNKIAVYLRWFQTRGFPDDIPDEQENDLGGKDIPSWRRICKTLIRNDFWCRTLSFAPNRPRHYLRYCENIKKKRTEWGIL